MFKSRDPISIFSEHDSDDDLIEETEAQEQARIEERNANATVQNMPERSSPASRQSWPPVWLQEWERRELAAEDKQNEENRYTMRPNIDQFKEALKILGLSYLSSQDRTEERANADFKRLIFLYAIDKMNLPNSEVHDPKGEDCSTLELRSQAWMTRMQRLVSARDIHSWKQVRLQSPARRKREMVLNHFEPVWI